RQVVVKGRAICPTHAFMETAVSITTASRFTEGSAHLTGDVIDHRDGRSFLAWLDEEQPLVRDHDEHSLFLRANISLLAERPRSAAGPPAMASNLGNPECRPRLLQRLVGPGTLKCR